uniref:Helicase ATP-binding domain-containing protein n=1 Tax=Panagrolaimus sp. PS1159 TaxID=55785 RepID=A0AC35GLX4_9BILA
MLRRCNVQKSKFELNQQGILESLKLERDAESKETQIYNHQIDAVLAAVEYFNNAQRPLNIGLIQIPTGGGKSGIISLLPYALGSHKVLVLSPGKVITKQLKSTFGGGDSSKSFLFEKKVISQDLIVDVLPAVCAIKSSSKIAEMSKYEVVIVNAQKFSKTANPQIILNGEHGKISADIFEKFDTIIVDEAHHYPAKTWSDIIEIFNRTDRKIIFLTATPNPVAETSYHKIFEISRSDLEELRIIRKIEFTPLTFEDINNVNDGELHELAFKIKEVLIQQDNVVTNVCHKAMILVKKDKIYTEQMAQRLTNMPTLDLKATYCISNVQSIRNYELFDKNDSRTRIMVVCQKLTEGYDNHNVSVCAVLRNIGSDILFSQFIGRCIRVSHDRNNPHLNDVKAKVYGPKGMWDRFDKIAVADPEDDDGDDD